MSGDLTLEQKEQLIKTRLQTCTWGPRANTIQAKTRAQQGNKGVKKASSGYRSVRGNSGGKDE